MSEKQAEHIVRLNNVRLAFPNIFKAKAQNPNDKPAFSACAIMTPEHPDVKRARAAIKAVAQAKWGDNAATILKTLIAGQKVCLRDGDTKANYDGFPGNLYISARSPTRPLVIAPDLTPLTEDDGKPYSGCYVNMQVAIWAQDNSHGKRINAQLRGVQFMRDGEAFGGGGVATVDDFDAVDDSADEDVPDDAGWGDEDDMSEFL